MMKQKKKPRKVTPVDGRIISRLPKILADAGITSGYELAELLGCQFNTAYKLLEGAVPREQTLARICEALDLQPGDFIEYIPE